MKRFYAIATILFFFIMPQAVFGDDTSIYDVVNLDIDPNVLIVFDSSGSMETVDVRAPYNPATTYSGSYTSAAVYQYNSGTGTYTEFASSTSVLNCEWMRIELQIDGGVSGDIKGAAENYVCSGAGDDFKQLRTGNFLNYESDTTGATISRLDAMKLVIAGPGGILNDPRYANIRFGLMTFNGDDGGRLRAECGTAHSEIATIVTDDISGAGYTPLAETLYDAGRYFANQSVWISGTQTFTNPIDIPCRQNYVILTTDGLPRRDQDCILRDNIGDYDNDHHSGETELACGVSNDSTSPYSDYLDDVAKYLYDTDRRPGWPAVGE